MCRDLCPQLGQMGDTSHRAAILSVTSRRTATISTTTPTTTRSSRVSAVHLRRSQYPFARLSVSRSSRIPYAGGGAGSDASSAITPDRRSRADCPASRGGPSAHLAPPGCDVWTDMRVVDWHHVMAPGNTDFCGCASCAAQPGMAATCRRAGRTSSPRGCRSQSRTSAIAVRRPGSATR